MAVDIYLEYEEDIREHDLDAKATNGGQYVIRI